MKYIDVFIIHQNCGCNYKLIRLVVGKIVHMTRFSKSKLSENLKDFITCNAEELYLTVLITNVS
jgi:hypothetical protein